MTVTAEQACRMSYTPPQMIASIAAMFLVAGSPPGIDRTTGELVYPLTELTQSGGCVVHMLAQLRPDMIAKLAELRTHEKCPAIDLPAQGVPIDKLLSSSGYLRFDCDEWGNSRSQRSKDREAVRFIAALQLAHDHAAIAWYKVIQVTADESLARLVFNRTLAFGLEQAIVTWELSPNSVANNLFGLVGEDGMMPAANAGFLTEYTGAPNQDLEEDEDEDEDDSDDEEDDDTEDEDEDEDE